MNPIRLALATTLVLTAATAARPAGPDYPQGLRPPLADVLRDAAPDTLVPVSIVLVEQTSSERLLAAGKGLARREARPLRLQVLKDTARRAQAPLLAVLRELEGRGAAARIRPLWIGDVVGADLTPDAVRAIAARPEVAWVNYNPKTDISLENFTPAPPRDLDRAAPPPAIEPDEIECGVDRTRAPEVWADFGNTGAGAVIALIDTGVCWTHTDIANQIWVNPGEDLDHDGVVMDPDDVNGLDDDGNGFVDDLIGWDFDNNDREPNDDNSHGSHTAGTIAGDGTAGTQAGMAPDAKIMVIKVGVTFADEVDVWNAMQYAADNGADAISMSLGWPHNQNPDRATWRQNAENTIDAGTAMVVAAGNEGSGAEPDNVRTPGDVPRIITVGAVDCSDVAAGFSSRGPVTWQDVAPYFDYPFPPGLTKPDVAGPGVDTKSHDVCAGYSFKSGTSMATPHVAGAVALIVSANPGVTNDELKQNLQETAIDLGNPGDDNTYGAGRIDAYAAVQNVANPDGRMTIRQAKTSCQNQLSLQVSDSDLRGTGSVSVEVFSTTEPAPETAFLTEIGPTTGVFEGAIATDGGPVAADGKVQVRDGDTITARYVDANDGKGGVDVPKTDTAIADCRGPLISQVATSDVTTSGAKITWQTDEPSGSTVVWGDHTPPNNETSSGGLTTSHTVFLGGLAPCTTYHYYVRSDDASGNPSMDTNGGGYYHFETYGDFGNGPQPCHAGVPTILDPVVSCADTVPIRVVDMDLNLNSEVADTVRITVTSTTETTPETITLTETNVTSSVFTGSIPTSSGAPVAADGILQVGGGDVVSATYHDADDGTGLPAVTFDSADVDCAGPSYSNVQVTDIEDDGATIRWTTSEPATSRVDWGTTPTLGNVETDSLLATSHAVTIGPLAECGRIHFRITSTDTYGNARTLDAAGSPFEFNTYRIPGMFRDEFESSTGWTLEGEWQRQAPQAKGSSPGDPAVAFQGTNVLGLDLSGLGAKPGDYEIFSDTRAISPVIDATTLTGGQLKFRRWLNVGGSGIAYVEVRKNGVWNSVWTSPPAVGVTESAWSLQTVDVSAFADGNAQLQIAFRIKAGPSTSSNRAGWNVDRFVIRSAAQPDYTTCGGCGGAPTFAGLESAADLAPCADTGIALTWKAAPAWGTGPAGTYAVYRSTDPGFTPSAANLVAAGIAATTYTDLSAPNAQTLYYVVRAENGETCSTGPSNGGVTDANLLRVAVRDDVAQPDPGSVGASLLLAPVNAAQLRLTWTASPSAARYHVYRADAAQGPWLRIADVTGTSFDDRDEMGNLNRRHYVVRAADSCGNEEP